MSPGPHKAALRRSIRLRRRSLSQEAISVGSDRIAAHLSTFLPSGAVVGAFAGQDGEPMLQRRLETLRPDLCLGYPVVDTAVGTLSYRQPRSALQPVPPWGIEEPIDGDWIPPHRLDFVLVPGLAFGPKGERLGQGGGFYDRILPHLGNDTVTLGVGWQWQCIDALPTEEHDRHVMYIVTEEKLNRVADFPSRGTVGAP